MKSLKWRKLPTPKIDRALATNGAHAAPPVFDLVDAKGAVHARVQRDGADWRYRLSNGSASPPFLRLDAAKAAARKRVEDLP